MTYKKIRIAVLILALAFVLQGCEGSYSSFRKFDNPGCSKGGTYVKVKYGDSKLKVKPISKLHRGGAFEFRLKPKKPWPWGKDKDYGNALVTIEGKDGPGGLDANWIKADNEGNRNNRKLIVCVPPAPEIEKGIYYYSIKVEKLGILDPRADVQQ